MRITGYNNNNKPCLWIKSIVDGQQYLAEEQYSDEGKTHLNTLQKIFACAFGRNGVSGLHYIIAGKKKLYYKNGYIFTQNILSGDIIKKTKL